jgi:hypothetical protein
VRLGNRTNLPDAQKLGAAANQLRAKDKVAEIVDAIHRNSWDHLSIPALVEALNGIGLHSSRKKPWTAAALRRPHREALQALSKSTLDGYHDNPHFGQF